MTIISALFLALIAVLAIAGSVMLISVLSIYFGGHDTQGRVISLEDDVRGKQYCIVVDINGSRVVTQSTVSITGKASAVKVQELEKMWLGRDVTVRLCEGKKARALIRGRIWRDVLVSSAAVAIGIAIMLFILLP